MPLVYGKIALHGWRGIKSFLHVITERAVLANSVRDLDLSGWQTSPVSDQERETVENEAVLEDLTTASSNSIEEATQWKKSLGKGHGDAWIALVLPLLPHIRRLQLPYAKATPFLDLTVQRAVNGEKPFYTRPAFQHLREVFFYRRDRIDCADSEENSDGIEPSSAALLMSFFHFPSMRTIYADMVIDPTPVTSALNKELASLR
jgi:hypothetical protein